MGNNEGDQKAKTLIKNMNAPMFMLRSYTNNAIKISEKSLSGQEES